MYVPYTVGIAVAIFVLMKLFGTNFDPLGIFMGSLVGLVLSMPYLGADSKSIWAIMFFRYDEGLAENIE
jgi:hypothetical protein